MNELQILDSDFAEILIKHMARHPDVYRKCKQLGISGNDFVLDEVFGEQIYKEFVDTILNINNPPILQDTFIRHIVAKMEDGVIDQSKSEQIIEFIGYIFDTPLENPDFFNDRLVTYLHSQRTKRILKEHKNDPAQLTTELNKVKFQLDTATASEKVQIVHPFKNLIYKTQTRLIGTNICKLDEKIEGLQLGEYAQLIGYSGSGKSVLGCNIVCNCAGLGINSTYISAEDTLENMAMRLYSKTFRIPYGQLRKGEANLELEAKFNELDGDKRNKLGNCLSFHSVKGVSEITADFLYTTMVKEYEETGFVPVVVMLDQMQFVVPNTLSRKSAGQWEMEKQVSAELDELSHRSIGGRNFVLWVQHQAKGKLKRRFTREDIDGFKGIIHKCDLVVGIGRDPNDISEVDLFSIKVRHTADFGITLKTNFQYMDVSSDIGETVSDDYRQPISNPQVQLPNNPMANSN